MKRARFTTMCAVAALASNFPAAPASAQADQFIGQLTPMGFTFCPQGWAQASGQILSIAQNTALFALIGTIYGGNGVTTFALPDLRGRAPLNYGQGPGLSSYSQGQRAGQEFLGLTQAHLPIHAHTATVNVSNIDAVTRAPVNANFATAVGNAYEANTAPTGDRMNPGTVALANAGGSESHENMMPYLAVNWCIALEGIFPSRN